MSATSEAPPHPLLRFPEWWSLWISEVLIHFHYFAGTRSVKSFVHLNKGHKTAQHQTSCSSSAQGGCLKQGIKWRQRRECHTLLRMPFLGTLSFGGTARPFGVAPGPPFPSSDAASYSSKTLSGHPPSFNSSIRVVSSA